MKYLCQISLILLSGLNCLGQADQIHLPAPTQTKSDEQRKKQLEEESKEQAQMFWKRSSTKVSSDEGNKIVAVRRINLTFDDYDTKGNKFKKKKLVCEFELFSRVRIPVTNAGQYLIIGDLVVSQVHISGDNHTILGYLEQKQFESLKDGAIISYTIVPASLDVVSEIVKESYKNGEPEQIDGAKFGRIDKKAIEKLPVVEETSEDLSLRTNQPKLN